MNKIKDFLNSKISLGITCFKGVIPSESYFIQTSEEYIHESITTKESKWEVKSNIKLVDSDLKGYECKVSFKLIQGSLKNSNVSIKFNFDNWSTSNYVLMPAAAYNGNRYKAIRKDYPPMLQKEDGIGVDSPITISDVPRLEKEVKKSKIHLRSGDMATPYIGIYDPNHKKGFQLFAEHKTAYGYTGFCIKESEDRKKASVKLEVPAVREKMYHMGNTDIPSDDKGYNFEVGDCVELSFYVEIFNCNMITNLYDKFFNERYRMHMNTEDICILPFSAAFKIIEDKYIRTQWNDKQEFLRVAPNGDNLYSDWQAGWVGGGINSYSFLMNGNSLSKKRSYKTMDTIFTLLQAPSGYIYPIMYNGELFGDNFNKHEDKNALLVRKNSDILLFAAKHILLIEKRGEIPSKIWLDGFKKLADAFVRLWEKYNQFGQFVNIEKEEIIIGGTSSPGTAPGGLALAWKILKDKKYLDTAISSGEYYYNNYILKGITNGGPGEIMQSPDSESAFGLLESFITLYETTEDRKWITFAEDCAKQCSSWCVSYNFDFPNESTFNKLNINTIGSVFANVQNKHSAPGICTLSGLSLIKLYKATSNEKYLRLAKEITRNITQYLSREDRKIMTSQKTSLPSGWINERVNMSDWETKDNIGEVFYGSCWSEVSMLLTYNEIPGLWFFSDTGKSITFDNISVKVVSTIDSWILDITNPTTFDAEVKLVIETSKELNRIWGECFLNNCKTLKIPAGKLVNYIIKKVKG